MTDTITRESAEALILSEMAELGDKLRAVEAERDSLLARRRELYGRGRGLNPPVSGRRMAQASGVSDAALVLSARPRQTRRKAG